MVKKALDALALALTGHNHKWTKEERELYELAIKELSKIKMTEAEAYKIAGRILDGSIYVEKHIGQQLADRVVSVLKNS